MVSGKTVRRSEKVHECFRSPAKAEEFAARMSMVFNGRVEIHRKKGETCVVVR